MNRKSLILIALSVFSLLGVLILAVPHGLPLDEDIFKGLNLTHGENISGTLRNFTFAINKTNASMYYPNIVNITVRFILQMNSSTMYTNTISNSTAGSRGANRSRFQILTIDTTMLPDGYYNVTFDFFNRSFPVAAGAATSNGSFFNRTWGVGPAGKYFNFTIENKGPRTNLTRPLFGAAAVQINSNSGSRNQSFNVSLKPRFVRHIANVTFQFQNGTRPFNVTASNRSGGWGISMNASRLMDTSAMNVTVYARSKSGGVNRTQWFTLNVDRGAPTITLTKDDANSGSDHLEIDISTTGDAQTCTSTQGTVSGTGSSQTIKATGLDPEVSYSFKVTCKDEVGNSKSVTQSFSTDASSGGDAAGASGTSGGGAAPSRTTPPTGTGTGAGGAPSPAREETVERTPPAAAGEPGKEPAPVARAGPAEGPEAEETTVASIVGWVVAVVILVGLVVAYVVWTRKGKTQ